MAAHEKVPYVMTLKINDIVQCPGRCALTWTNDGLLLTAGETATVSVVRPGESKKYLNDLTNGDGIVTIAAHTTNNSNNHDATVDRSNETKTCPSKFIMGCITGNVYLSDTNGKKSVFVTHCELAIRYVSYSPNCKTIAVCSDDGVVRLLNSDDFKVAYDIEDHDGPVLSMAWSPNGDKLASLGDDGTLMIWSTLDWQNGVCQLLKAHLNCLPRGLSRPENEHVSIVPTMLGWDPLGEYLALPGCKNVVLMPTNDAVTEGFVLRSVHTEPVSMVAWSANGAYLATTGKDCLLVVWDVALTTAVWIQKVENELMGLAWSPVSNELAVISNLGEFKVIKNVVPDSMQSPLHTLASRVMKQDSDANDVSSAINANEFTTNDIEGQIKGFAENNDGLPGESSQFFLEVEANAVLEEERNHQIWREEIAQANWDIQELEADEAGEEVAKGNEHQTRAVLTLNFRDDEYERQTILNQSIAQVWAFRFGRQSLGGHSMILVRGAVILINILDTMYYRLENGLPSLPLFNRSFNWASQLMNPPGLPHVECENNQGIDGILIIKVLRGVLLGKKGDWTGITRRYFPDERWERVESIWIYLVASLSGMGWGIPAHWGYEGADDDQDEPDPELSD